MAWPRGARIEVQRGHYFAIVDEVDSILIDEARTPLIISGPAIQTFDEQYGQFKSQVESLVRAQEKLCARYLNEAVPAHQKIAAGGRLQCLQRRRAGARDRPAALPRKRSASPRPRSSCRSWKTPITSG